MSTLASLTSSLRRRRTITEQSSLLHGPKSQAPPKTLTWENESSRPESAPPPPPSPFGVSTPSANSSPSDGSTSDTSPQHPRSTPLPSSPREQSDAPTSLEGTLSFRRSKNSAGSKAWKQVYVVFDMRGGGSLSCYKQKPPENQLGRQPRETDTKWAKLRKEVKREPDLTGIVAQVEVFHPKINLPQHVNWLAKDIDDNPTQFVIEIPVDQPLLDADSSFGRALDSDRESHGPLSVATAHEARAVPLALKEDIDRAKEKGENYRIHFRCVRNGNEKLLWMRAFEQIERLSHELHVPRGFKATFTNTKIQISTSRVRSSSARRFAEAGLALEDQDSLSEHHDDPGEHLRRERTKAAGKKEYLVYPLHVYPNRWMTESELYIEMLKPSKQFHDLRLANAPEKEIGILKVEVLQCVGLPVLDFASETDAVIYLVCGSYVFTTDVIWNRLNPIWLPKARRACIFPLFHAYANLYVGVFDDDGKGEKDDFAGRVALDVARFRPNSTYDVTLPLRLSTSVYTRRQRGSIRLRFSIEYHSERDAILSYVPKKMSLATTSRPDNDVTIQCADEKAFRNIVTTVHGVHMPGRYSFSEWKACMQEANFARKALTNTLIDVMWDLVTWANPAITGLVFLAWMHAVYKSAFSLVPLYTVCFLLLMMMQTYVFYGSDGPIQKGFTPPSWEELFGALVFGGKKQRIEPLKVKPKRLARRTYKSARQLVDAKPETHKQRGKWLFRILGFNSSLEDAEPQDYDMEFPYAQGLRDPVSDEPLYPKYSVKESLVPKSTLIGGTKKRYQDEEGDNMLGEFMDPTEGAENQPRRKLSLDFLMMGRKKKEEAASRRKSSPAASARMKAAVTAAKLASKASGSRLLKRYDEIPPRLIMPEQNIDAKGRAKKKKLADELAEVRDNIHKLTFHSFNDRTHLIRQEDATYFGQAGWGRLGAGPVENELERLLNIGQHSSANPLVVRIGTYLSPMVSAVSSGLSLTRVVYNIATWRDPIMSFWFTIFLGCVVVVLAIFPWRIFFFVSGCLVVGPQNWMARVMHERGTTPKLIQDFLDKLEKRRGEAKQREKERKPTKLRTDQPIISCHSADRFPPPTLSHNDVDHREIHEVSVPYSQLMYHRMYDWPPEPQYAKCEPILENETSSPRRGGALMRGQRQEASRRLGTFDDSSLS